MSKLFPASLAFLVAVLAGALLVAHQESALAAASDAPEAPPFTHTKAEDWLNSPPLTWADLRGKVVLIDVWTFDCWNCYRSIPWLHTLGVKFPGKDFEIVGVHTPELPHEYVLANVKAKLKEFEVTNPVMVDNDYSYWKALSNRYWPAFYLVDRRGKVRGRFIGETHVGDGNALKVEKQIAALLAEPATP
ncbi:MAG: redoxin family protein [Panacagrimonas sp.]